MAAIAVMVALARPVNARIVTAKKKNKSLQQIMTRMTTVNRAVHSAV
jgi:hypothetical protein